MRKTAFLIAAHHQPDLLARTARKLSTGGHVFINIDGKFDLTPFADALRGIPNVHLLPDGERVKILWGGFTQAQASITMINKARAFGGFGRYCLMTGADYPIKPMGQILERLSTDEEFIRVDRKLGGHTQDHHNRHVRTYWFYDYPLLKPLNGKILRVNWRTRTLYHGSSWCCLTSEFVEWALKAVRRWTFLFKTCAHTDEMIYQTLAKHSPFADRIVQDFEREPWPGHERSLHGAYYIDWDEGGAHPKTLTLADLDTLLNSSALFARKVHGEMSKELLDELDRRMD